MNFLTKTTRLNLRKTILKKFREAVRTRFGPQSDVCGIWASDGLIYWETTHTNGIVEKDKPIEIFIRKLVGQNLLTLAGIPKEKEDIPIVFLAPFPSLIECVGLKRYLKLIKEWPGKSEAMGIEVVRYRVR